MLLPNFLLLLFLHLTKIQFECKPTSRTHGREVRQFTSRHPDWKFHIGISKAKGVCHKPPKVPIPMEMEMEKILPKFPKPSPNLATKHS